MLTGTIAPLVIEHRSKGKDKPSIPKERVDVAGLLERSSELLPNCYVRMTSTSEELTIIDLAAVYERLRQTAFTSSSVSISGPDKGGYFKPRTWSACVKDYSPSQTIVRNRQH